MTNMLLAKTRMIDTMLRKRTTLRLKKISERKVSYIVRKMKTNCTHKL